LRSPRICGLADTLLLLARSRCVEMNMAGRRAESTVTAFFSLILFGLPFTYCYSHVDICISGVLPLVVGTRRVGAVTGS
jgi:hypothetical protein